MCANQIIIIKDASLMNVGMLIIHKWLQKRPAESIALTGGLKLYMYMTHAIRGRERQDHVLFKCFQRRPRRRVHYVVVVAVVYTAVVNATLSGCPLTSSAHYVKSITLTCDNLRWNFLMAQLKPKRTKRDISIRRLTQLLAHFRQSLRCDAGLLMIR